MVSGNELKKWLLENCVNERGQIDLSNLDLSDNVIVMNNSKCKHVSINGSALDSFVMYCSSIETSLQIDKLDCDILSLNNSNVSHFTLFNLNCEDFKGLPKVNFSTSSLPNQ